MISDTDNSKALDKTDVRRCFTFFKSDEYPNGSIKITKEDALKLQKKGWEVKFHTENYLSFIGCNFNGLEIGFCNWMTNLDAIITTPEVGYYGDSWLERVKFKNKECLYTFIDTISNLVWMSKNNA